MTTNLSPIEYGMVIEKEFIEDILTNGVKDRQIIVESFNNYFEDILINDVILVKYTGHELSAFITYILLSQARDNNKIWDVEGMCDAWYKNKSSKKMLQKMMTERYNMDNKGNYYEWKNKRWILCDEKDILNDDLVFDLELFIVDFKSGAIDRATNWFVANREKTRELIKKIDRKNLVEYIKDKKKIEFNKEEYKLQVNNGVVNFQNMDVYKETHKDYFTQILKYDIYIPKPSTDKFMDIFNCAGDNITEILKTWACRGERTLTFIVGSQNSGKSVLCRIAHKMYEPYAVYFDNGDFNETIIDYKIIRTCFIDNDETFIFEDFIRCHPCVNLVFTCKVMPKITPWFGDRKVLVGFLEEIVEEKIDKNIEKAMINELGGLLGWLLIKGNEEDSLLEEENEEKDNVYPSVGRARRNKLYKLYKEK